MTRTLKGWKEHLQRKDTAYNVCLIVLFAFWFFAGSLGVCLVIVCAIRLIFGEISFIFAFEAVVKYFLVVVGVNLPLLLILYRLGRKSDGEVEMQNWFNGQKNEEETDVRNRI